MGASVYIVTDNDLGLAQGYADELAGWIWERRADWHAPMPPTREALAQATAEGKFPVIFADRNDNTGGGSPGDSTGMLQTFMEAGLEDACILYIVDPEAVSACQEVGVGATLTLDVGAKSTPLQGQPIRMTAEVVTLSDGSFRYDGPRKRRAGEQHGSLGIYPTGRDSYPASHGARAAIRHRFFTNHGLGPAPDALYWGQIDSTFSGGF